jgi:hypothetical protein
MINPNLGFSPNSLLYRVTATESLGGADRDRTGGLRRAKPALSQLSYSPDPYLTDGSQDLSLGVVARVRNSNWWA